MDLLFAESSISGWGTEQHCAALAIAMARKGHGVRCLVSPQSPLVRLLREAGLPVLPIDRPVRGSLDPQIVLRLRGLISQRRTDWVITNDPKLYWPLIVVGRLGGVRTALFRHWEYMSKSLLSRRLIPRLADRFILVSNFQREHLRRDGVDVRRMRILYNPIDTQRLSPSAGARARVRQSLGVTDGQILIGYVGRMVREKGIFTLLSASEHWLPAAPEARLVWVGDGAGAEELRARAAESGSRSRHLFQGWTDDTQGIYAALDVAVIPSLYPEPFGRVSVEAQSCGTAVICTDAGGLPETLSPGVSGLLVPKGDPARLAEAILELVRDRDRRQSMALAGRQFACANFSFDRIADDFTALLANDQCDTRRIGTVGAAP